RNTGIHDEVRNQGWVAAVETGRLRIPYGYRIQLFLLCVLGIALSVVYCPCYLPTIPQACTLIYPIVLTTVHCDGTYILSLHSMCSSSSFISSNCSVSLILCTHMATIHAQLATLIAVLTPACEVYHAVSSPASGL